MTINFGLKILLSNRFRLFATILVVGMIIGFCFLNLGMLLGIAHKSVNYYQHQNADLWVFNNDVDRDHRAVSLADVKYFKDLKQMEGVESIYPIIIMPMRLLYKGKPIREEHVEMIGYNIENNLGGPWEIVNIKADNLAHKNGVIINDKLANSNNIKIDDYLSFLDHEGNNTSVMVVGICKDAETVRGSMVFVPLDLAVTLYPTGKSYSFYLIKSKAEYLSGLINKIEQNGKLTVLTKEKIISETRTYYLNNIAITVIVMSFVLILVCIIIISISLYTLSCEKQREYAILKAIGTQNRYLNKIILFQSLFLSTSMFIIGIFSHFIYYHIFSIISLNFHFYFSPFTLLIGFIILIIAGVFSSLLPLRAIKKIDPLEVFK